MRRAFVESTCWRRRSRQAWRLSERELKASSEPEPRRDRRNAVDAGDGGPVQGLSLSLMAAVLGSTIYHTLILGLPSAELVGGIGLLALAANLACLLLLMRYKDGDANVRSVWLCSRNDAIGRGRDGRDAGREGNLDRMA